MLEIQHGQNRLYFRASKVLEVSATHLTFLDKFGKQYSFRLVDVIEINEVGEPEKGEDHGD